MIRFFECLSYLVWIALLIGGVRSRRRRSWRVCLAILIVCPVLILPLEILNDVESVATCYGDGYLLLFPGFHFPVAILFMGAAYVCVLHGVAHWLSHRGPAPLRHLLYWLGVLVLSVSAVGAEALGIRLELWRWYRPRSFTLDFALGVWKYYATFILGAVLAAQLGERILRRSWGEPE